METIMFPIGNFVNVCFIQQQNKKKIYFFLILSQAFSHPLSLMQQTRMSGKHTDQHYH